MVVSPFFEPYVKLVLREAEGCGQPIIKNLKNINKKSFLCTAL
jgi:hypothetical protein